MNMQEVIDENDGKLTSLRKEFGEDNKVYKTAIRASNELNEYNVSGRYPVPELWNTHEERKASLKEGVAHILKLWKIEVLRFNCVEDLKGFKIKQLVPRESLEELRRYCAVFYVELEKHLNLKEGSGMSTGIGNAMFKSDGSTIKRKFDTGQKGKGIQCRECERYDHIHAECANTLKKNRSMNITLNGDDKKSDSKEDEEDTDSNETLAFNVIIELEDTSMHIDHKDDTDDDSIYSDEELLYTNWVGLVKLHQELKDSLKKVQEQKDALEERNYELIAQVKDATERVNVAEGKIVRLNTGNAKLEEIISMGRAAGMKLGLGYTGTNLNHTTGFFSTSILPDIFIFFAYSDNKQWQEAYESMKDIDEGIEDGSDRKHNAERKRSSGLDLEKLAAHYKCHCYSQGKSSSTLCLCHQEEDQHMYCYLQKLPQAFRPKEGQVLDPLVMPKIVAPGMVPPSQTLSTQGHTGLDKSTRQQLSKKKQPSTKLASPSPPPPSAESSKVTNILNQQLSSVMASVLQMQQDLQNLNLRLAVLQFFEDILQERRRRFMVVEFVQSQTSNTDLSSDMEVWLREVESIKKSQNPKGKEDLNGIKTSRVEVVLLFNGVKDLKGFKVKQLVPRGSLEELKGFQLCYGSTVLRIEGSSSPCNHTLMRSLEELKGFNRVWIAFWPWRRRYRLGRTALPTTVSYYLEYINHCPHFPRSSDHIQEILMIQPYVLKPKG
ncbi:hypothetical protein M9H77_17275 [Catharanthus roseus]|uniref:Uncharacterized protein n=1 Tax=Catharanthus roseus TaxID=4058 RepID=A0ACC0B462_CATRO|nr:hypothetical protein M9H77_17275 [Catharanthus roseus]